MDMQNLGIVLGYAANKGVFKHNVIGWSNTQYAILK
jgi:hypothetical protein